MDHIAAGNTSCAVCFVTDFLLVVVVVVVTVFSRLLSPLYQFRSWSWQLFLFDTYSWECPIQSFSFWSWFPLSSLLVSAPRRLLTLMVALSFWLSLLCMSSYDHPCYSTMEYYRYCRLSLSLFRLFVLLSPLLPFWHLLPENVQQELCCALCVFITFASNRFEPPHTLFCFPLSHWLIVVV